MPVKIEGWQLTLFNDCNSVDHREHHMSSDGRVGSTQNWQRSGAGADPDTQLSSSVSLMSLAVWKTWTTRQRGRALECGHHMAEEMPNELAREILAFLREDE